jgi:hypothetical protein
VAEGFAGEVSLTDEEQHQGLGAVRDHTIDTTVKLATLDHQELQPHIRPKHVERKFRVPLVNYPRDLVGIIDLADEGECVIDLKTAARSPSADAADKSTQLTMYSLGYVAIAGRKPKGLALHHLVATKVPKAVVQMTDRDENDQQALLNRVGNCLDAIERDVYVPASEDHWCCSPRWCGYYNICKYVRGRHRPRT